MRTIPWIVAATIVTWAALPAHANATPEPPRLSHVDQLRALHEKVMEAHRRNDARLLLEDQSEDYVVLGRGEVTHPTVAERQERFSDYLGRTRFTEYRDLIEPIVTLSKDETLGWVVVQVQVRGIQTNEGKQEPLAFTSAWIELYERRNGRWWRIGNASNFKEP